MKIIFSNFIIALLVLLVAQTVSAIPISSTTVDSTKFEYSALSTQPTSSLYAGSRLHSAFRSMRNFTERNVADDVTNEAILVGAGDSLVTVPVLVTVATVDDFVAVDTVDYFSSKGDGVNVPEPSILALIAIGLVAVGFVYRRKNIK